MLPRNRRGPRSFRPTDERLESRLVMSGNASVAAEVRALLAANGGGSPIRPNTPVLPLESPYATATFIDPSAHIVTGKRQAIGQKDYIAPNVTLDASKGVILIGSSSTIQDDAKLIANPGKRLSALTGIFVGDNVVIGDGAVVRGPAAIGSKGGAATSIGANALIDGAIIAPGAFVGALARVGPGVYVPAGYRVLPGASVTNSAQATNPSLGKVIKVTSADTFSATATKVISASVALASGYVTLYHGNSAAGGAASAGPIPSAISAAGSSIFFGELNTVLGASSEPGSKNVAFEPASGTPIFLTGDGTLKPIAINLSYRFPARVIGAVSFTNQSATSFASSLGHVGKVSHKPEPPVPSNGVTIRADEGQPFMIGSVSSLGRGVSIHSPGGGVQGSTTTTVVTSVTDTKTHATTTTTTATTATSAGAPTATAGTTTTTTTGINAAGDPTTGTVTTTIAVKSTNLGAITIGQFFAAGEGAVILGSPTAATTFGDGVTIGVGAVVSGSTIGNAAQVGNRAYVSNSTIPTGTVVPDGAIIINNKIVGNVQW